MTDVVDRYLRLGLRLGRLEDGLVDTYFGPPEIAAEVDAAPPPTAAAVADEAEALLCDLPDGWLRDQVTGVRTYAGVLAGQTYTFADEVHGCYGVRPAYTDESIFEAAHEQLADLLPGVGPVGDRLMAWRKAQFVAAEQVEPLVAQVIARARAWTDDLVALPEGEGVELEIVRDQTWSGFNQYLGDLRGRVSVNADLPRPPMELLHLTLHETYPGHQAERALKDHLLVREQGRLEETLVLGPTPQSLISEGLAEVAPRLVLAGPAGPEIAAGLGLDLDHALAVDAAVDVLRWAEVNAALLRYESGAGDAEVHAYLCRWGLMEGELADHVLRFMDAPGNRTYLVVYPAGRDLCRSFVDGDLGRFRRLLTEQIRVYDLL
ncbi:MAG: hypothetical protein HOV79_27210 [Hamadaea sp.]|nr:hypothetical protein [Hamadaea sp.]